MKNIIKVLFLLFFIVLIASFIVYKIPNRFEWSKNETGDNFNQDILDSLSLDQKIGQLFIIGINDKVLTSETEELIKETHAGGILLLSRNIENEEQLKELIISLQKISLEDTGLPLFIAVDQEGGLISRIDWLEKTPQSQIENKEQAYQIGKDRGEALKELGINLNLAPLLDISYVGDFIYERTFQKDSDIIKELAQELVRGQKESGILTCIKHFPGYGNISFNPEEKLAFVDKIPETSQFQIDSDMIMTSNVVYKEIGDLVFTFSEKGIKQIKGDYLIISDDLAQNSLLNEFSLKDTVSLPIKAGIDMLIFSGWRKPVIDGIQAFKESNISEQRINQSVLKIIKLKQDL